MRGSEVVRSAPTRSYGYARAIAAAAFVVAIAPIGVSAEVTNDASARGDLTFDTSFVTADHPTPGAYVGILKIRIDRDGTVSGIYRSADRGSFVDVTGGLEGDRIHLDIGDVRSIHIVGTYDKDEIDGGTWLEGRPYAFTATPHGA